MSNLCSPAARSLLCGLLALAAPAAAAPPRAAASKGHGAAPKPAPARLSPKEAERLGLLGKQQFDREEYDKAIASFQRAYELGRNPLYLFNIASAYRRAGKSAPAAEAYERFLKEEPEGSAERPRAEKYLGELRIKVEEDRAAQLFADKQFTEAAAIYASLYKLRAAALYLYQQGVALRLAGRDAEAAAALEKALPGNLTLAQKDDAETQLAELRARVADRRARELLDGGKLAEAVKSWQTAYKYKSDAEYLYHAAQAQRQAGLLPEAIKTYERILEEAPQSPRRAEVSAALIEVRALVKDRRAAQLLGEGQLDKALLTWDEAYEIHSTPLYVLKQARALRRAGEQPRALGRYEQYLRDPRGEPQDRRTEAQLAAAELRELLGARREAATLDERLRKPPVYKRGWFIGLMIGAAALAGAGAAVGTYYGVQSRPTPPPSDLGDTTLTFSLGR